MTLGIHSLFATLIITALNIKHCLEGATTIGIITLRITIRSVMTLSTMIISIKTLFAALSITAMNITTIRIMTKA